MIISTNKAPKAIGPYSQAVACGDFIFLSGQIALSADGTMSEGGIQDQTKQVFKNIMSILDKAELSKNKIIKTTVFLKNLNDFAKVNKVYESFFSDTNHKPARSCVEVSRLPKEALVEIEVIAYKK